MKRLHQKLHSEKGETLVEVLATILIATLSVTMLLGAVAASAHIGRQADDADARFYQMLTDAESHQTVLVEGVIKIEGADDIPIEVFGGEGLYSYGYAATAGGDAP